MPIKIGEDKARTNPTIKEATIAPCIDPIVPKTMTANEGKRRVNAVSGLYRRVIAKIAPPIPEIPADKKALVNWILSTLMPLLAANSGLSATARIFLPRRVFVSNKSKIITEENITAGTMPL